MRKKIKGSLFAKVFLTTVAMLSGIALLVYGLLAWLMPRTYSNRLNAALDGQVRAFLAELEQVSFSDSGGLFGRFLQNTEIDSVELYDSSGAPVPLPTEQGGNGQEVSIAVYDGYGETEPVLSGSYYFSFLDREERYLLLVYGTAERITELQQAFLRIFPLLLLLVLGASLTVSLLYAHMVTKPVLALSRISEKMSALQLEWQQDWHWDGQRTDELGTLGKNLNTLSRNLSAALLGLQNANRKLAADMEHEKELERARTSFFSAVSHELKTPVTIIKGQLEGMLLGIGAYQDREKYLARSLEIVNTLETMVQEILTISRLETAGTGMKKERLDCVQMVKAYLKETEDLIAEKELRIQFEIPGDTFIQGNKMLMEKVFTNLIGNAVKYAPVGASIRISAYREQERSRMDAGKERERVRMEACREREGSRMDACREQEGIRMDACREGEEIRMDACREQEEIRMDACREGERIQMDAYKERERLRFAVENTGTYIPEDDIPKVFEAFYRVEQSRNRKTGGSGLGLYIVQEILRQHGSECKARNTLEGVEFFFFI